MHHFWSFDDGTTSTERVPIRTYDVPGVYTVKINVTSIVMVVRKVQTR